MATPFHLKSTTTEIQERFDKDVDRFSNLETGQLATMDAALVLDLVACSASAYLKPGDHLLDLGCGAGNFTLRVLQQRPGLHCQLVDLSQPMLTRAEERLHAAQSAASFICTQSDLRQLQIPPKSVDCILAAAVLHHLREESEWQSVFRNLHACLKPGGRVYVFDLMPSDIADLGDLSWQRYGEYLTQLRDSAYRDLVFEYIDREDTPRSLHFQIELLKSVGFSTWDVLHRNAIFGCYVAGVSLNTP